MPERAVCSPEVPRRAAPGRPMRRVLVADDQEASRQALRRALEVLGYDAEAAADGFEVARRIRTDDEWEIMKTCPAIGARILHDSPSPLLQAGEVVARSHHERWDGSGYPDGLRGEEIPLSGRICAVADVFDAVTNNRHYRDALPNATVWEMMEAERGRYFDPAVLDVFLASREAVEAIHRQSRGE